eukprot:SAG31_NODE_1571_length_7851_cov_8.714525_13_plen_98_part_00
MVRHRKPRGKHPCTSDVGKCPRYEPGTEVSCAPVARTVAELPIRAVSALIAIKRLAVGEDTFEQRLDALAARVPCGALANSVAPVTAALRALHQGCG